MKLHMSASNLWRREKCPASASLPRVASLYADAEAGTEEHAEIATDPEPGERREVAYALNVFTGKAREIGQNIGRHYGELANGEIPGTADSVRFDPPGNGEAGRVVIRDDKTGFGYMVEPDPAKNLQLLHNAVAAADVRGVDLAWVSVRYTALGTEKGAALDAFDLAAARQRIRAIYDEASKPDPRVVTGTHCWRCECISNCPAHLTMAIAFREGAWPGVMPTDGLTAETVADGWEYLCNAKRMLGLVEKTYRAFASAWPVKLSNGNVLGEKEWEREELDGTVAYQVLRDLHGDEVAKAAVGMETSKAALERALATVAPPRGKAKLVREAVGAIKAANGVVVKRGVSVEEHKPEES